MYNGNDAKKIKNLNLTNIKLILGGNNRQASTFNALKYLIKNNTTSKVLIHDAARPNFSLKLLRSIVDKSKKFITRKRPVAYVAIKQKNKKKIFSIKKK